MLDIVKSTDFNINIYKNKINKFFNTVNKFTVKEIKSIEESYNKDYFIVPYIIVDKAWGYEKIYYPFTTKLFKIINTTIGNTSLQLHPLKNEQYISLSDNTIIYSENGEYNLKKNKMLKIPKCTVHRQKLNSIVFEEQDNVIFDEEETIRYKDDFNRKISSSTESYKYLLPQYKKNMEIIDKYTNKTDTNYDKFAFIIDGSIELDNNVKLEKQKELYFIKKNVHIKKINGQVYITNCEYYKI